MEIEVSVCTFVNILRYFLYVILFLYLYHVILPSLNLFSRACLAEAMIMYFWVSYEQVANQARLPAGGLEKNVNWD